MKENFDFSKCPHFDAKPCPGQNLENMARAVNTQVVYVEDGTTYRDDLLDFVRQHRCGECPKNKKATPSGL